jgi:hypothetical protein
MTDGNTYAINKRLNDQEDWDALQEVTAELEQTEARIEELEAKLAKAMQVIEMIASADVDAVLGEAVDISCEIIGELMEEEEGE